MTPFANNKIHGTKKIYYENGNVMAEITLENGIPNGFEKWYDKRGNLQAKIKWVNGTQKQGWIYGR